MSSFIVNDQTINRIAAAIGYSGRGTQNAYPVLPSELKQIWIEDSAQEQRNMAELMFELNLRGTGQRYTDTQMGEMLPGQADYALQYRDEPQPTIFQLYQHLGCLLYQCTEGDTDKEPLYVALDKYHDAIAHRIASRHEKTEATTWG